MGNETSSSRAGNLLTFMLGMAGTTLVFAAFYLRHPKPIHDHQQAYGLIGILVAGTCLVALAAGGGLWAAINKPRTRMKAFSLGLSLPAVVFAAGGADGASEVKEAAVLSYAFEDSIVGASLRLVFAPVDSKSRADSLQVMARLAEREGELRSSQGQLAALTDEIASKNGELSSLTARVDDLQAELADHMSAAEGQAELRVALASYRRRLDDARAEFDPAELRQVEQLVDRLDGDQRGSILRRLQDGDWSGAVEHLLKPFNGRQREASLICAYLPFAFEQLANGRVLSSWRLEKPKLRVVFQ